MRKSSELIKETIVNRGIFLGTLLNTKGAIFQAQRRLSGACEKVTGENEERNRSKMKKYILQEKIQTNERRRKYEIRL